MYLDGDQKKLLRDLLSDMDRDIQDAERAYLDCNGDSVMWPQVQRANGAKQGALAVLAALGITNPDEQLRDDVTFAPKR